MIAVCGNVSEQKSNFIFNIGSQKIRTKGRRLSFYIWQTKFSFEANILQYTPRLTEIIRTQVIRIMRRFLCNSQFLHVCNFLSSLYYVWIMIIHIIIKHHSIISKWQKNDENAKKLNRLLELYKYSTFEIHRIYFLF